MASGHTNNTSNTYLTRANVLVDSEGYSHWFMDGLQYNISDWIVNGGLNPDDNLDEEETIIEGSFLKNLELQKFLEEIYSYM